MKFYRLEIGNRSCVNCTVGNDWEKITCPKDDGHQRAGRRTTPLTLELTRLKTVDFSSTILADVVISDRAWRLLTDATLTGFGVQPVILKGAKVKKLQGPPLFWEFCVIGNGGFAHPDSGIVLKTSCDTCGLKRYSAYEHGIKIDAAQWDGADFFTIREYGLKFCSERARTFILEHGLTNVEFCATEDLRWPEGVVKP